MVGIDAYKTSQACPVCYNRVVKVPNTRRRIKQCVICDKWFHMDVASGQLIASLAKRKFNGEQYPKQFNRPDRPPAPPATQPPPNPLDLLPIPEASIPDRARVDQEDGNPQNFAVDEPGQANQAHQAHIQTLCRKRKLKSIDNQFSKKPMLIHSK